MCRRGYRGSAAVILNWSATTGATSYNINRSLTSGSGYATIAAGVATTTYTDYSVSNGTTYYYEVSAVDAGGVGPNSAQASALPAATRSRDPVLAKGQSFPKNPDSRYGRQRRGLPPAQSFQFRRVCPGDGGFLDPGLD